jgi:hypothetical protein
VAVFVGLQHHRGPCSDVILREDIMTRSFDRLAPRAFLGSNAQVKWAWIELCLSPHIRPACRFAGKVGNEGKLYSASAYEQIWIELTVVFDANDEPYDLVDRMAHHLEFAITPRGVKWRLVRGVKWGLNGG